MHVLEQFKPLARYVAGWSEMVSLEHRLEKNTSMISILDL